MTQSYGKLTEAEQKQVIQALDSPPRRGRAAEAQLYIPLPTSRKSSGIQVETRIVKF
jgi:hypothetical protein